MNLFERYLTVWVGLCIIVDVLLGQFLPNVFHAIASIEIAKVNIPVSVLVWMMIIPMRRNCRVDFVADSQRTHDG
jgi:ACR3 family arsenite transporter